MTKTARITIDFIPENGGVAVEANLERATNHDTDNLNDFAKVVFEIIRERMDEFYNSANEDEK